MGFRLAVQNARTPGELFNRLQGTYSVQGERSSPAHQQVPSNGFVNWAPNTNFGPHNGNLRLLMTQYYPAQANTLPAGDLTTAQTLTWLSSIPAAQRMPSHGSLQIGLSLIDHPTEYAAFVRGQFPGNQGAANVFMANATSYANGTILSACLSTYADNDARNNDSRCSIAPSGNSEAVCASVITAITNGNVNAATGQTCSDLPRVLEAAVDLQERTSRTSSTLADDNGILRNQRDIMVGTTALTGVLAAIVAVFTFRSRSQYARMLNSNTIVPAMTTHRDAATIARVIDTEVVNYISKGRPQNYTNLDDAAKKKVVRTLLTQFIQTNLSGNNRYIKLLADQIINRPSERYNVSGNPADSKDTICLKNLNVPPKLLRSQVQDAVRTGCTMLAQQWGGDDNKINAQVDDLFARI